MKQKSPVVTPGHRNRKTMESLDFFTNSSSIIAGASEPEAPTKDSPTLRRLKEYWDKASTKDKRRFYEYAVDGIEDGAEG